MRRTAAELSRVAALAILVARPSQASAQAVPAWRLSPVAVIGGSAATRDEEVFDQVPTHGLVGTRDGHLFLLDPKDKRVLEFDSQGRYVRTIGRAGEGPGEFRSPYAIALGPDQTLWISELLRHEHLGRDGKPLRDVPLAARTFGQLRSGPRGRVQALSISPLQATTGSLIPAHAVLGLFNDQGAVRDTLWSGPMPRRVPVTVQVGKGTWSADAVELLGTTTYWDILPDGSLAVADTSAYLVRIVSPDGKVLRTIGPGTPGRSVTPAMRDAALAGLRTQIAARKAREQDQRFRNPEELWQKLIATTPIGSTVQAVGGVRADAQGRIWVGVVGTPPALDRLDVYDATGTLLARVPNPRAMPAAIYGEGLLAFLERDDADAQQVRIERVATGR